MPKPTMLARPRRNPVNRPTRTERIAALDREHDVLVVGGGITGAGVALDLAARGLSVVLTERNDWASATSSASSRLVHGGLRYLEQYDFALVRESCLERGLLLRNAAGLVWPERFVFPIHRVVAPEVARVYALSQKYVPHFPGNTIGCGAQIGAQNGLRRCLPQRHPCELAFIQSEREFPPDRPVGDVHQVYVLLEH